MSDPAQLVAEAQALLAEFRESKAVLADELGARFGDLLALEERLTESGDPLQVLDDYGLELLRRAGRMVIVMGRELALTEHLATTLAPERN